MSLFSRMPLRRRFFTLVVIALFALVVDLRSCDAAKSNSSTNSTNTTKPASSNSTYPTNTTKPASSNSTNTTKPASANSTNATAVTTTTEDAINKLNFGQVGPNAQPGDLYPCLDNKKKKIKRMCMNESTFQTDCASKGGVETTNLMCYDPLYPKCCTNMTWDFTCDQINDTNGNTTQDCVIGSQGSCGPGLPGIYRCDLIYFCDEGFYMKTNLTCPRYGRCCAKNETASNTTNTVKPTHSTHTNETANATNTANNTDSTNSSGTVKPTHSTYTNETANATNTANNTNSTNSTDTKNNKKQR